MMKMSSSSCTSSSATTVAAAVTLAVLSVLLIGWAEEAAAHPLSRALSPVLRNPGTYENVQKMARQVGRSPGWASSGSLIS